MIAVIICLGCLTLGLIAGYMVRGLLDKGIDSGWDD